MDNSCRCAITWSEEVAKLACNNSCYTNDYCNVVIIATKVLTITSEIKYTSKLIHVRCSKKHTVSFYA